jgi:hypothetical protein
VLPRQWRAYRQKGNGSVIKTEHRHPGCRRTPTRTTIAVHHGIDKRG